MKKTIISIAIIAITACNSSKKEELNIVHNNKPNQVNQVLGVARIEPEDGLLAIYASSNGTISKIIANENQSAKKGQVIITIDNSSETAKVLQANSKLIVQQQSIASSEATTKTISDQVQKAREDYLTNQKLFEIKAITLQKLNDIMADWQKLENEYHKALKDEEQAKAKIKEIDAEINVNSIDRDKRNITATHAGKVLEWTVHSGDFVNEGDKIGQFEPSGDKIAITEVDELFADRVKIGMNAIIKSEATDEVLGKGMVIFAAEFLKKKSLFEDENDQEDRRVRTVKIRLNSDCKALTNSRVNCIIYIK
jgi:multidrug resistance efflux pump